MAKAEKKRESGGGGGGVVGFVVVTLLAIGCGAGFGFFLDAQMRSAAVTIEKDDKAAAQPEEPQSSVPSSARLVALTPIVVNMAEPKDAWMRIEASILVDGMSQGHDTLAAQVAEDMVAYLRTMTLAQFEGPSGFLNLREDFVDRATIRGRENIKDVIIHGMVVE